MTINDIPRALKVLSPDERNLVDSILELRTTIHRKTLESADPRNPDLARAQGATSELNYLRECIKASRQP